MLEFVDFDKEDMEVSLPGAAGWGDGLVVFVLFIFEALVVEGEEVLHAEVFDFVDIDEDEAVKVFASGKT
jgi:hypothetical protein